MLGAVQGRVGSAEQLLAAGVPGRALYLKEKAWAEPMRGRAKIRHTADLFVAQDGRVVLRRIQFLRGSHQQDMDGWPNYWPGLPPMWYAKGSAPRHAWGARRPPSCFSS